MTPNIMDHDKLLLLRGPDFKGDPSFGNAYRQDVQDAGWQYQGPPVRTLQDMTAEEIAAIEKQYGCPVRPKPPKEPTHAAPPFDCTRPVIAPDGVSAAAHRRVRGQPQQSGGRPGLTRTGKRKR